ncbi:MAG: GDP-fucose synthetase [Desulfobulbaceae bacterium A2]|nr:MAG: GDP-fucose synthetase [Desulfobulbaceae bacterium A2]
MDLNSRIYVAGHRGLVGAALCRALQHRGFTDIWVRTRHEMDLTDQSAVRGFFAAERPDYVFLAAARVGGIHANDTLPADFLRDNILIQTHILDAAREYGVKKLLFLGSSCIYPKMAPQPLREEYLLTGPLEPTNEWYAVAKIAGIKLCQALRRQYGFDAISLMPTNLYGPGDNFHPDHSHVLPGLLRRFHEAKLAGQPQVSVWGSGRPLREFLHVDDLADASLFLMQHYESEEIINVGSGTELSIADLAGLVARTVGFCGEIVFDPAKPDGTPRKLLDCSRLAAMGWQPRIDLVEGLKNTYAWFLAQQGQLRAAR